MEDYIVYGLNLSRDGAYMLAAASIIVAVLTVAVTVITLVFTVKAIQSAARENRLSKELERQIARDMESGRWLLMASGLGEAETVDENGRRVTRLNAQLIGAAMLTNHPNAKPGAEALLNVMQRIEGDGARQIATVLAQSIEKMGAYR